MHSSTGKRRTARVGMAVAQVKGPARRVISKRRLGARGFVATVGASAVAVLGLHANAPASAETGYSADSGHAAATALGTFSEMSGPNVVSGLRPDIEGPGPNLYSVAAISSDDAWSVGLDDGLVRSEHWDGSTWSLGHTGIPGGSLDSGFYGVSADASDDVWAVGRFNSQATKRASLVAHWNGKKWSLMHAAEPVGTLSGVSLFGVDALSPTNVWAVGYYLDDSVTSHPVIEHWDGSRWSIIDSPPLAPASLGGLDAVSPTDIWAVGGQSDASGTRTPVMEHWDGSSWSIVKAAVPPSAGLTSLLGVSAVAANDAWAVGAYLNSDGVLKTLTEQWDGKRWKRVASPNIKEGVVDSHGGDRCGR